MKKRIILIGAIYYRNLGDAALCYSVREMLSEKYEVTVLDIYGRTEFPPVTVIEVDDCRKEFNRIYRRLHLRRFLTRFGIVPYDSKKQKMFEAIKQQLEEEIKKDRPAAIVFAGGALLKGVFINSIVRIEEIAARYDIPIMFNACGIEADMRPAEWKIIGDVLQHPTVKYVSVRDGYDLLKSKFPKINLYDTYDTAICADRLYTGASEKKGIGLGIMLSHNFKYDMQVRFWSRLISRLNKMNCEWYLFTNGAPADQGFAAYLLEYNHENESRLIPCPETPEDLYVTISGFNGIISMRLHSHILAYASGVPAVAVSWDRKLEDFFEKIGWPENCFTFDATTKDILSCLKKSMKDKNLFDGRAERKEIVQKNMNILMDVIG